MDHLEKLNILLRFSFLFRYFQLFCQIIKKLFWYFIQKKFSVKDCLFAYNKIYYIWFPTTECGDSYYSLEFYFHICVLITIALVDIITFRMLLIMKKVFCRFIKNILISISLSPNWFLWLQGSCVSKLLDPIPCLVVIEANPSPIV